MPSGAKLRAEDISKHLRRQAESGILGMPSDGFYFVSFGMAADTIDGLLARLTELENELAARDRLRA